MCSKIESDFHILCSFYSSFKACSTLKAPLPSAKCAMQKLPYFGASFFLDSVAIFRTLRRTSRKLTGLQRKHRTERGPWPPNYHYPTKRTFPFYPPPSARHTAATFKTIRLTSFPPTKLWAGMSKGHRAGQGRAVAAARGMRLKLGLGLSEMTAAAVKSASQQLRMKPHERLSNKIQEKCNKSRNTAIILSA